MMCLRDRPLALAPGPIAPMHLGRDHHLLPLGEFLERAADDLLARALRIDVGGVEEIDAALERLANEGREASSSSTQSRHFVEP